MNDDEPELSCSTRKENDDFEEEKHKWDETIKALDKAYFVFHLACYIIMSWSMLPVLSAYVDGISDHNQ